MDQSVVTYSDIQIQLLNQLGIGVGDCGRGSFVDYPMPEDKKWRGRTVYYHLWEQDILYITYTGKIRYLENFDWDTNNEQSDNVKLITLPEAQKFLSKYKNLKTFE